MPGTASATSPPLELFAPWDSAQRLAHRLARAPVPSRAQLRSVGAMEHEQVARIADWYLGAAPAVTARVRAAYAALADTTRLLYHLVCADAAGGGLGVRVTWVRGHDPYATAADLCADLRERAAMRLRTIADAPAHPLLDSSEGGPVDQLRVVHDVLGHAALGVGFDLQSEYAAWRQCAPLFGPLARAAAFTELVGAVTAYVTSGSPPPLRADLPPALLAG